MTTSATAVQPEYVTLPLDRIRESTTNLRHVRIRDGLSPRVLHRDFEETPLRIGCPVADMRFPLDLLWIDADGQVIAVLANVATCPRPPCPLYEPEGTERSVAVLESAPAPPRITASRPVPL